MMECLGMQKNSTGMGAGREAKMLIDELIPTIDVPWKIFER